jgi:protein ImuA
MINYQLDRTIEALRTKVRALEHAGEVAATRALPFGSATLDEHLPWDGLPLGALHETCVAGGIEHEAAATLFIAGILARIEGSVLWCVKKRDLFAPGLAAVGLDPNRIIYAEAENEKSVLLIMEEGLRHPGLAGVVGEITRLPMIASRRLHLAARTSGVTAFALHRVSKLKAGDIEPSAAMTRWRVSALPSSPLPVKGIGRARWNIELTYCRDAEPHNWSMEACDEEGYLAVPAELGDRSAEPERQRHVS